MPGRWLFSVALIGATPVAAGAQDVAADARCLLVGSTYARTSTDDRARQAAASTVAYYLGRVDGRVSPAALKAAFAEQQKLLNGTNGPTVMQACLARVAQAEKNVQAAAPATATPPAAQPKK